MMLVAVKVAKTLLAKLSPAATQWLCTPLTQVGTTGTFATLHKSGWGLMPLRSSVVDNLVGFFVKEQLLFVAMRTPPRDIFLCTYVHQMPCYTVLL
ncbi:MAG: hypothetical protein V7K27_18825 [Nostoc sp.]|uniref:hypothetical protein n=1 Tax=Nostoc sp. TaxID=1180 RepID=UPI002FF73478